MNVLHELLTQPYYMVSPGYLQATRDIIQNNIANHLVFSPDPNKVLGYKLALVNGSFVKMDSTPSIDSRRMSTNNNGNEDPSFISVYNINGPITRGGDDCSYGSKDHRNMMMDAANNSNCIGHIFLIDTPGGSAWAKNDYQQAIDYAHSKGQPVIALVDGDCCSAGMYLACLCDNRYYVNAKDTIGCIGVLAAFYTQKDGEKCEYTGNTYHEIYDPESFNKNEWARDIANNNDDKLLVEELTKLGVEFRDTVKKSCPKATDEHLHGKTFDAVDVKGILMDGQKSLSEVCQQLIDTADSNAKKASANSKQNNIINSKIQKDMNKKYVKVAELCNADLQFSNGGTFLNETLLDSLESGIENLQAASAERDALKDEVTKLKAELAEKATAAANDGETVGKKTEELNVKITGLETKVTELTTALGEKETTIAELNGKITAGEQKVIESEQKVADLNAKIVNLTTEPSEAPKVGTATSNGQGAAQPKLVVGAPAYDHSKSAKENAEIRKAYEENRQSLIGTKTER